MLAQARCPYLFGKAAIFMLCVAVLASCLQPGFARAQDASMRPPHASEAVTALERGDWEPISGKLSLIDVSTALGTRVTAIRVDTSLYQFSIVEHALAKGERASRVQRRLDAALVVNGGFFSVSRDDDLKPVGMLIIEGEAKSKAWTITGGFVALDRAGSPSITLSPDGPPMWARNAVQSKPVLIEPGGSWAMNTNGTDLERRTLFCLLPDGDAIVVLVHGGGLTLFEAGWMLRAREWGGYFNCDSAIALDGGGSTQLSVKDRSDLDITGLTRVQNFLVVSERESIQ
jgi:hypothetical protein